MNISPSFSLSRAVSRLTGARRAYPAWDTAILWYVAAVLFTQVLLQISPVVTLLAATPLIHIQAWLGLLGVVLVVIDLFTARRIWHGPYCLLLYGILALAALASVRMADYGVKENLFKLGWALIQFALVYSLAQRTDTARLDKYVKILFTAILIVWVAACCVSLYQLAFSISYDAVVDPTAQYAAPTRQGFYNNRLYGIFYTLNHAAYVSLLLFLTGLVYLIKSKKRIVKLLLTGANFLLLCHIVGSQSRSAIVALCACVFLLTFLAVRSRLERKGARRLLLSAAAAVCALLLSLAVISALKAGLAYVPHWTAGITGGETTAYDPDLLDRPESENGSGSGRLKIWRDYASLSREIGPIGISPGNYMPYIYENHSDLFIVDFIRTRWPDRYASGLIYHMHSGYLMVYVSAGWLGAGLMAAFALLCILRLLRKLREGHTARLALICSCILVAACGISAVFDEGIFFQNTPHTTVFWLALGVLMKLSTPSQKKGLPTESV